DVALLLQALQPLRNGGWRDAELIREARTDDDIPFHADVVDGLEVLFGDVRVAGRCRASHALHPLLERIVRPRFIIACAWRWARRGPPAELAGQSTERRALHVRYACGAVRYRATISDASTRMPPRVREEARSAGASRHCRQSVRMVRGVGVVVRS